MTPPKGRGGREAPGRTQGTHIATLSVGSGKQFSRISDAVAASRDGDTVDVDAGTYINDFSTVNTGIAIQAVGGMAHLIATVPPPDGKAILTVNASATTDHLELSGAAVADANGAGVRYQGGDLVMTGCCVHDNENGILGGYGGAGTVTIRASEFAHNGNGLTHNIYVGDVASLTVDGSYIHDAVVGHEIKSRAGSATVTNSRIQDGPDGAASYSIDAPNGGAVLIQGNVIQQGRNSQNPAVIAFGEEGNPHASNDLRVIGNTILNDLSSPSSVGVWNATSSVATAIGNSVFGLSAGQISRGPAAVSGTAVLPSEPTLVTTAPWTPAAPTPVPVPAARPRPDPGSRPGPRLFAEPGGQARRGRLAGRRAVHGERGRQPDRRDAFGHGPARSGGEPGFRLLPEPGGPGRTACR